MSLVKVDCLNLFKEPMVNEYSIWKHVFVTSKKEDLYKVLIGVGHIEYVIEGLFELMLSMVSPSFGANLVRAYYYLRF